MKKDAQDHQKRARRRDDGKSRAIEKRAVRWESETSSQKASPQTQLTFSVYNFPFLGKLSIISKTATIEEVTVKVLTVPALMVALTTFSVPRIAGLSKALHRRREKGRDIDREREGWRW